MLGQLILKGKMATLLFIHRECKLLWEKVLYSRMSLINLFFLLKMSIVRKCLIVKIKIT